MATARDHRQILREVFNNGTAAVNEVHKVWIADISYVPQHARDPSSGATFDEYGEPFDITVPGNVIDSNGTSGSCTFDGYIGSFEAAVLLADGICLQAPAPTVPNNCDVYGDCPPL